MNRYAVGIDLGGTNIKAALVERGRGLVEEREVPTEAEEGPEHVLDRMAALVKELRTAAPEDAIAGVGVGAPGAVNWERTTASHPPNFPGWRKVNVQAALQKRCGHDLHAVVENDANVAAFGSAHYSVGRPYDSFIMVTLGTGVGGAIIYQNKIFRGATGGAGEIGHMTIDYEGPVDRWGVAGAVEAYLGQEFLSRHARYRLLTRHDSLLHERAADAELSDLSPRMLYEAARDGDEAAREMLAWAGHKLGCALSAAVNLLDISTIVVGGGVSRAGDFILEPARASLVRYVMPGLRDGLKVLRETRGNEVGMLGAAHLAFAPTSKTASMPDAP